MIYVGIDDTDTLDTPGTNQLARFLMRRVADSFRCLLIIRHQLLIDPRVPYTSHNGSAALLLQPQGSETSQKLVRELRRGMLEWFKAGSDPGLCVAESVPPNLVTFGQRCQREVVSQDESRALAAACGVHLEGLGGTEDGVIGALAAVGLAASGHDGRVVQIGSWPDDLSGEQELQVLHTRGIEVLALESAQPTTTGMVDVGKKLRPNYRHNRVILYVTPTSAKANPKRWQAVRLP